MPLAIKMVILPGLMLICSGAAYIMIARAPAIMIDLSNSASAFFCL